LVLARVTALQISTRNQFGNPPGLMRALRQIESQINTLISELIPDPREREQFLRSLNRDLESARDPP
jgi:hypothetical protein